jgi:glycerophosphoryl diester phosphodiesterase
MQTNRFAIFDQIKQGKKPYVMAHRGSREKFPENTIAAFEQAFIDGADILETDLQISNDGQFMCIHDETIDRTTNGSGLVSQNSVKELKEFQILDLQGQPSGLTIPTLSETARILPVNKVIALELKSDQFLKTAVCENFAAVLEKENLLNRAIILSFNLKRLHQVKEVIPQMPIGWITLTRLIPDEPVDLIGAIWPIFYINPFYVRMAHRRGIFVCPLDPKPESRLGKYIRMGCDAVLADNPETVRRRMNEIHARIKLQGRKYS